MILRDKKNHMILWSTKCISQERIDGSNNNKKEREKLRVKRKWTIGNKTQIKRHYVYYCVFVDEIKYMRKHTHLLQTERPNFTIVFCTQCSIVHTFNFIDDGYDHIVQYII